MAVRAVRFVAYDGDDPNGSPVGELTESAGKFYDDEYNGTGGGELQVSRHSTQAHWSDPGAYIRVYLDGLTTCRGAFWVTQSNDEILGPDEDGIEVYRRQGSGALYYLSDFAVLQTDLTSNDSAVPLPNTDVWQWVAPVHPAGILVRLLEEAQAFGALPDLTYDFTRTTDSNGAAWTITIDEPFQITVGTNLLEVVAKLQELGVVLKMDDDLLLHAYESVDNAYVGRDLSATVTLTKGADIVDSAERQQVGANARSSVLVKGTRRDNGEIAWVLAQSAAALSEIGREKVGFLDAGSTTGFATLQLMGLNDIYRKLRLKAGPTAISATDPTATGKRALIDYVPGDQITVDIPGVFNAVAKPITSIQIREREAVRDASHEDTGYSDYDVVVGFDEDPARLDLPADISAGPAGTPDSPCCPDEGPFVPPSGGADCDISAQASLAWYSTPDHDSTFIQGVTPAGTLVNGFQYRIVVDVVAQATIPLGDTYPMTGAAATIAFAGGSTAPIAPGHGSWTDIESGFGGANPDSIAGSGSDRFAGGHFVGPWGTWDDVDTDFDVYAGGSMVSGFYGNGAEGTHWAVTIETRNGDHSAIVCDDSEQTVPHEGQSAAEQSATGGTSQQTNFPYIPGSLQVWVGGVLVTVVETDPTTGLFELPFDPGSHRVVVVYQATGGAATGGTNVQPSGGVDLVPDDVLPPVASVVELPFPHGSMGATETLDLADATWHTGTLNADVTLTVQGFTADVAGVMTVALTQDGTGNHAVIWDADVDFGGADDQPDQTAESVTWYTLWSVDGDGTIYGAKIGGGSGASFATPAIVLGTAAAAGAATTTIRSDATIVAFDATAPTTQAFGDSAATGSAAVAARRDHKHAMPAEPAASPAGHAHVVSEAHLSNGSGTTYTLDQYFEPGSVIAWNTTTLARLGVTETLPDQATVSAAGSSGDTIQFDYAATLS